MSTAHALAATVASLADRCVQCGLCLPACPTYAVERIEAESPRGRIALARAWTTEAAHPTPAGETHLDHCLGCRNCEAVCPAQVDFGALLIGARTAQRQRRGTSWRQRAIEMLARRPRLLTAVLRAYRVLLPVVPPALRVLPRPPAAQAPALPASAVGPNRVALFTGCVARAYEPAVRHALSRICAALGVTLVEPEAQTCCGGLHAHAGDAATATRLQALNAAVFPPDGPVLTLASGCHEAVADALPGRTVDALAWVAARLDALPLRATPRRVGLHLPCTQRNVVGSAHATRMLLARIPGLEMVALDAGTGCCGAAGTAMLLDRTRAAMHRAPVLAQAHAAQVDAIASANIGCRLHLAHASAVPVLHPLELVAEALDDAALRAAF